MKGDTVRKSPRSWLSVMLVLTLFCVFAVSALLDTLFGARAYRNIVVRSERSFALNTPLAYLTGRVQGADARGAVFVEPGTEGDVLCLEQMLGGRLIQTRIYIHQGRLYELTALPEAEVLPEHGQPLMPLARLSVTQLEEGILRLEIQTTDGQEGSALVFLRAGGR